MFIEKMISIAVRNVDALLVVTNKRGDLFMAD